MAGANKADTIRRIFAAYLANDRQFVENAFSDDPAGGKAAAAGMYDGGADVVYHASGGSGAGVFDAAVEAGENMWAIGVDSDQYLTASEDAPG